MRTCRLAVPLAFALFLGAPWSARAEDGSRAIGGIIRDGAGKPVAGARVLVLRPEFAVPTGSPKGDPFLRSSSTPEGTFVVEVPDGPPAFHLLIQAPAFETLYLPSVQPEGEPLDLMLRPGAKILGKVVASDTLAPLTGADVHLRAGREPKKDASLPPPPILELLFPSVATDGSGGWSLGGLAPGLYELKVSAPGRVVRHHADLILRRAETRRLDTLLSPATSVAGRVTGPDGKPLPGVTVLLMPARWHPRPADGPGSKQVAAREMRRTAMTGADGGFLLDGVTPKLECLVLATLDGHADGREEVEAGAPGETKRIEFRLYPAARLSGTVVDELDGPVNRAFVLLRAPGAGRSFPESYWWDTAPRRPGETDDAGRFEIPAIPPGTYDVRVRACGRERETGLVLAFGPGERAEDRRIRLVLGKRLSGRVIDEEGQPVAEAGVRAEIGEEESFFVRTDAQGRFEFRGLPGESCTLYAFTFDRRSVRDRDVEVPTVGTGVEVVLPRAGSIAGRVLLETGEPAPAVVVATIASQEMVGGPNPTFGWEEPAIPTVDGTYVLEGLQAGTWNFAFSAPGYVRKIVEGVKVELGRTTYDVNAILSRGGTISGTVVRASDGTPVPEAGMALEPGGIEPGVSSIATSDLQGLFRIEGVPPGTRSVFVGHPDFVTSVVRNIAVRPGEETVVQVALGQGGSIEGIVTGPGGKPRAGVKIVVLQSFDSIGESATTGADGRYRVERLPVGPYSVIKESGRAGGSDRIVTAVVKEGEIARVDFREESTVRLTGRILRGGQPAPGAAVLLGRFGAVAEGGDWLDTLADDAGRYTIEGLVPGRYDVRFSPGAADPPFGGAPAGSLVIPEGVESVEHDFVLSSAELAGRVIDAETQKPIDDTVVEARLEGTTPKTSGMMRLLANDSAIDRTDSEGGFRFALGSEGRYRVVASAMGYVASDPVVVQVPSAEAKDLRIALHRGTSVRVRVLDEAGQPVSRAFVVASPGWGFGLTFTDPAGIFVLGVPEGESGSAVVVPTGRAPLILTDLLPSPEEIVVRTTPGGSLELLVRASPESRSKMTLELRDKSGTDLLSALAFLWSMMGGMENELATAGRIFFPHLAPGLYTVIAGLDGKSATLPAEITEGSATRLEVGLP